MGTAKKPPLSIPSGGYRSTSASPSAGSTTPATRYGPNSAPTSAAPSAVTPATPHPPSATSPPTARARSSESMPASEDSEEAKRRKGDLSQLILVVRQQPERARLCSYKEENDTVDRRPVDPPPVVELASTAGTFPQLLDSTSFFIRASLVAGEPSSPNEVTANAEQYAAIRTPTGAEPTSGEVIQTPERLKHLDGTPGALCIFPKLSVRLPGVFRLKFTLFETKPEGMISEITHVVSAPFEVFSPKLFKGMHESTALTRHLANQGLKVKLRTDANGGKGSSRRRASVASFNAPPGRADPESSPVVGRGPAGGVQPPHLLYAPMAVGPTSAPPYGRNLVWHQQYHHHHPYLPERDRSPEGSRKRARTVDWRDGRDDGLFELNHITSKLDFSAPSPSSDLSAFSLGHAGRPTSAPSPPGLRWPNPRDHGADDGFPALPGPSSRRHYAESSYRRDYPEPPVKESHSPSREMLRERELHDLARERERDIAREHARERDNIQRERALWERDSRGGSGHVHHNSYSSSRSYSPSGPPLSAPPNHPEPPSFALPRLPPIVQGDPMDPRASHTPGGHPYPPPPPHGHHQPHSAHTSPLTPQGHSAHPPYPPSHPSHGPPSSSGSGPQPHSSHGHAMLPPIRERSPVHTRVPPPYERDPRR